jgi:hypothetical protein
MSDQECWDEEVIIVVRRRRGRTSGGGGGGSGVGGGQEAPGLGESTDFTRTAASHPDPATSDYAFTAEQTFATNARSVTSYGGGILVADSASVTSTYTAAGNEFHVVKFGVHIPATGEVTVTTKIDDVTQQSWKTGGEYNTTSSVYNLCTPSIALTVGQVLKVELAYTHGTPGDDSTKMLVDFATFTNSAVAAPPPSGTLVWDWDAGDISKATYDAYVTDGNGFTLEANGRLTADNNTRELALATSPQRLNIPISFEAPSMEANGDIRAYVEPSPTNSHSMFRMESSNFSTSWYVAPRTRFRWELSCTFLTATTWTSVAWAIPIQLHPGSYPAGHDSQPVVALYAYAGANFTLTVRGNNQAPPAASWTSENDFTFPFSDGFHTLSLEFESDPNGSGSFCKLTVDNVVRVNTTVPLGLMYSGHSSTDAFLTLTQGCYTTSSGLPASPNHAQIDHHSGKLYQL